MQIRALDDSSDSSMDDCNPFTPTQKRVLQAGSDSSMDCNLGVSLLIKPSNVQILWTIVTYRRTTIFLCPPRFRFSMDDCNTFFRFSLIAEIPFDSSMDDCNSRSLVWIHAVAVFRFSMDDCNLVSHCRHGSACTSSDSSMDDCN